MIEKKKKKEKNEENDDRLFEIEEDSDRIVHETFVKEKKYKYI